LRLIGTRQFTLEFEVLEGGSSAFEQAIATAQKIRGDHEMPSINL
jgi:hypothetical protein